MRLHEDHQSARWALSCEEKSVRRSSSLSSLLYMMRPVRALPFLYGSPPETAMAITRAIRLVLSAVALFASARVSALRFPGLSRRGSSRANARIGGQDGRGLALSARRLRVRLLYGSAAKAQEAFLLFVDGIADAKFLPLTNQKVEAPLALCHGVFSRVCFRLSCFGFKE